MPKTLVILGSGTAGTILANGARKRLPDDWRITVVDPQKQHLYQPGLLFLPFGAHDEHSLLRPRESTLRGDIDWRCDMVAAVDPKRRVVHLEGSERITYDLLIVATGAEICPQMTPGLLGEGWRREVFDFYTLDGALALREALARFNGGRLVVNVVEMPIKCPVAPLEFLFLADDYFRRRGIRRNVELVYVTPLDAAFTKPIAARRLAHLLEAKGVLVETDLMTAEVDPAARCLRSYDQREVPYDLLVTIPTHAGAAFIEKSGIGNELRFVPTDLHTLRAKGHERIFVLGDATDLPSSKAGSVAHFQAELMVDNLLRFQHGDDPAPLFDGHTNCFIETGHGKAMLIDFNYDTEPLPGRYPVPEIGPFTLLEESRRNHWGKKGFRWMYWNMLLPARPVPVSSRMSMKGKKAA